MNDDDNEKLLALTGNPGRNNPPSCWTVKSAWQLKSKRTERARIWGLSKVAVIVLSFSVVLQLWINEPAIEDLVELDDLSPSPVTKSEARPSAPAESQPLTLEEEQLVEQESTVSAYQKSLSRQKSAAEKRQQILGDSAAPSMEMLSSEPEMSGAGLADQAPLAASASDTDVKQTRAVFPNLPTDINGLSEIAPGLRFEEPAKGEVLAFDQGRVVLRIFRQDGVARFRLARVRDLWYHGELEPDTPAIRWLHRRS